jgi:hypothetical protein
MMHAQVQCDRHAGISPAPKCGACDSLTAEYRWLGIKIGRIDLDGKPMSDSSTSSSA